VVAGELIQSANVKDPPDESTKPWPCMLARRGSCLQHWCPSPTGTAASLSPTTHLHAEAWRVMRLRDSACHPHQLLQGRTKQTHWLTYAGWRQPCRCKKTVPMASVAMKDTAGLYAPNSVHHYSHSMAAEWHCQDCHDRLPPPCGHCPGFWTSSTPFLPRPTHLVYLK
jgi:hypothetical protein